jgi:hypothetical protein
MRIRKADKEADKQQVLHKQFYPFSVLFMLNMCYHLQAATVAFEGPLTLHIQLCRSCLGDSISVESRNIYKGKNMRTSWLVG